MAYYIRHGCKENNKNLILVATCAAGLITWESLSPGKVKITETTITGTYPNGVIPIPKKEFIQQRNIMRSATIEASKNILFDLLT